MGTDGSATKTSSPVGILGSKGAGGVTKWPFRQVIDPKTLGPLLHLRGLPEAWASPSTMVSLGLLQ
jgi:hypothetical protein